MSEATASSSCNVELPDQPDPTSPRKHNKCNFFVKEGKALRVLRVGHSEVLNTVIALPDEFYVTCGRRFVQMGNTAMKEGFTPEYSCLEKTPREGAGNGFYSWAMAVSGMLC